jgi:hypothetical protein
MMASTLSYNSSAPYAKTTRDEAMEEDASLTGSSGGLNNQENELARQKRLEMEREREQRAAAREEEDDEEEDESDVLFSTLPKELLVEIFGFCTVNDVCTARGVSRGWRRLIERDALLWRRLGRKYLALVDIEEFMTPHELARQIEGPDAINWVNIYKRVFGGGWDDTPQTGTWLSDNGRTISYMPGESGYRCFISKKAFDKGKHYIEVHFKTLAAGYAKGVLDSNTYGFGFGNRTIYTLNGGSSYLSSNNGRGWYDNGNAYNIDDESTTLQFKSWKEKDTLGVFLDFDENKAAFFKNRERATKFFKIFTDLPTTIASSVPVAAASPDPLASVAEASPASSASSSVVTTEALSLATSPPCGIHIACLTAKGGEWTLRYCGSSPPLDVAVDVEDN